VVFHHGILFIPGDGKTFYIKEQLKKAPKSLTIAINEAFSVANAVRKLQSLSTNVKHCALYFNFTLLPPGVSMLLTVTFDTSIAVKSNWDQPTPRIN